MIIKVCSDVPAVSFTRDEFSRPNFVVRMRLLELEVVWEPNVALVWSGVSVHTGIPGVVASGEPPPPLFEAMNEQDEVCSGCTPNSFRARIETLREKFPHDHVGIPEFGGCSSQEEVADASYIRVVCIQRHNML